MNNYQIKDVEDVFGDPMNSNEEFYSTMADEDENTSSEEKEEAKSDNSGEVSEEKIPAEKVAPEESTEESIEVDVEDVAEETDAEKSDDDEEESPAEEESVETAEASQEDEQPSEPSEEDSTEIEESKAEEVTVDETSEAVEEELSPDETPEDTEDEAGEKAEKATPAVQMDPEEASKLAMQTKIVQATYADVRNDLPRFRSGDRISIGYRVIEGSRSRVQTFEGVVIKISSGHGLDKTFTVRKISGGIGVERIFPYNSPNIESIKVLKEGKVRRAKLYYLRSRKGKATRIKEKT